MKHNSLAPKERAKLAGTIWESLGDPYFSTSDISEKEALDLAQKRDLEIENGEVIPLSHDELMKSLKR